MVSFSSDIRNRQVVIVSLSSMMRSLGMGASWYKVKQNVENKSSSYKALSGNKRQGVRLDYKLFH